MVKTGGDHASHVVQNTFMWTAMLFLCTTVYGLYPVLVHLCETEGRIPFQSTSVVLIIEIGKLLISFLLLLYKLGEFHVLLTEISKLHIKAYLLTAVVPGMLYSISNNIGYIVQTHVDPTSYQILSNMKIAVTAVCYTVIIKRPLTFMQWLAIGLLTVAGTLDSYGGLISKRKSSVELFVTVPGLIMIGCQCMVSGLAGVYSEYILKQHRELSINLQNMMLYSITIVINLFMWIIQEMKNQNQDQYNLLRGYSGTTWIIVISQICNGLMMSIILKYSGNITRLFVISGSLVVTTASSLLIFQTHMNQYYLLSIVLLAFAVYIFYKRE